MRSANIRWTPKKRSGTRAVAALTAAPPGISIDPTLSSRDEAVFLLHAAAEIEHSLLVQYPYAAFSLRQRGPFEGPQVPANAEALTGNWYEEIFQIGKEEMGHLMTVLNILRALGGPLTLD